MLKRRVVPLMLAGAMVTASLAACGSKDNGGSTAATDTETTTTEADSGQKEELEFYHAYYHDKETWPVAEVMRNIYQDFADQHANDSVTFKPIAVEDVATLASNEIAGGSFPNMVDFAGNEVPLAAISQGLVLDLKSYIDQEGLQSKVGINYTMNEKDGAIYTVHDQLTTLGLWYNEDVYKEAGAKTPDSWNTYEDMAQSMDKINAYGNGKGIYAYSAGQGSIRLFNAYMGLLDPTAAASALTEDIIKSDNFTKAFTTVAKMDQANGSANASDNVGDFSSDFTGGKCATWLNGVWGAGAMADATGTIKPGIYPGSVSLSAPGGGLTISSSLSDGQKQLALEFLKYMTSDEVQTKIFLEVNANPCNQDIDLTALAAGSDSDTVKLLAEACKMANEAGTVVNTINYVWGSDVQTAIINKLIECSVAGTDVDAKCSELQDELIALIA